MTKLIVPNKNIFLGFCKEMQEICKPLKQLGITYFNYVKIYKNGSRIDLCNNLDFTDYYYFKAAAYQNHSLEAHPDSIQSGFTLWKGSIDHDPTVKILRDDYNTDHGATLVKKTEEVCEIFYFASTRENGQVLNLYLNKFHMLMMFIYYFLDKGGELIKQAEINKILMDKPPKAGVLGECLSFLDDAETENFSKALNIKRYYFGAGNNYLTKREVECLQWCVKGKTAEETALILQCSPTTVITHLESIKKKLGCYKQIQLATQAYDLGLVALGDVPL